MNYPAFLVVCGLLFSFSKEAYSQQFIPGPIVKSDSVFEAGLAENLKESLDKIDETDSDKRKYLADHARRLNEWITGNLKAGTFLLQSPLDGYVNSLLEDIKKHNASIDKNLRCLVVGEDVPNAFDIGNGHIIMITGLLERLENEAQLAFVLCHEAAHYQLGHVAKVVKERSEKFNEKKMNDAAREALKQKYQVKKKFDELIRDDAFSFYSRKRSYELEADSLALQFYRNTGYSLSEAVRAIDKLDHIDGERDTTLFDLRKIFSTGDYVFSEEWLYHEDASSLGGGFTHEKYEFADSLKTHPDCKVRSAAIAKMTGVSEGKTGMVCKGDSGSYDLFRQKASGEIIYTELLRENLGRTIYHCLYHLQKWPDDPYAVQVIGISLAWLSKYKSEFKSGSCLDLPSSNFSEKYNRLLEFLSELKAKEAAMIGYWFLRRNSTGIPSTEMELAAHAYTAYVRPDDKEAETFINQYRKMFPEGVFYENLNTYLEKINSKKTNK